LQSADITADNFRSEIFVAPPFMLRRLYLFLCRGSAIKHPEFDSIPFPKSSSSFASSFSPKSQHRAYLFSAVGGVFVVASVHEDINSGKMAPLELPGRQGNLTDEEKVKLKDMWSTAFKVFGIVTDQTPNEVKPDAEATNEVVRTGADVPEAKEKKGKLTSLFKRKKDRDSSSAALTTDIANDVSKLSITDGDDKYSQTKEFKEALATSSPQEIRDTFWKMVKADHPDSLFLRFLRARKWDVGKAIVMLVATMRWRNKELDVRIYFLSWR
jgi:CRAL/TRIO, N-terminal domain